jgi:hypothetical protein
MNTDTAILLLLAEKQSEIIELRKQVAQLKAALTELQAVKEAE